MTGTPLQGQQATLTLAAKVAVLREPDTYPEPPTRVEALETHMSWVFLTDRYAYKIKKPVRYEFLDFSTLALRQQDCAEEVRLNRRLAADVYLGTVALARDARGKLRVGGEGEVVEWLVQMRRLPAERMLDHMIRQGTVQETDIQNLAATLARFYQECPRVALSGTQYRAEFEQTLELNLRELSVPDYALPLDRIEAVHAAQARFLSRQSGLFDARAQAGMIVEGHGDLRPEHICFEPDPVIIDCLEFNRRLRTVDSADELSYLAMECEYLGAPHIGDQLFRAYETITHDRPAPLLVTFYKSFRACLRARFAIAHVRELEKRDWPKWRQHAETYLNLAAHYGARLSGS
jgi:aminoglycoside phosphotransferase family enzyme